MSRLWVLPLPVLLGGLVLVGLLLAVSGGAMAADTPHPSGVLVAPHHEYAQDAIQETGRYTVYVPFVSVWRPIPNGGFETSWGDGGTHRCLVLPVGSSSYYTDIENIFVLPAWTFWFVHEPDTWDQPEGRPVAFPERVHSGEWGYSWFTFYRKHDAGLFQQVDVLTGTHLRLTAWAHAWSNAHGGLHPDDPYWSEGPGYDCGFKLEGDLTANSDWQNFTFRLGIDPTGGTDPLASTVVWGQGAHIYNCYAEVPPVEATAASGRITVFLQSMTLWPFKHNDAYWDDVALEHVSKSS